MLPQGWFQAGRILEVHDAGVSAQVMLLHVVQDGPDFERVSFRHEA